MRHSQNLGKRAGAKGANARHRKKATESSKEKGCWGLKNKSFGEKRGGVAGTFTGN